MVASSKHGAVVGAPVTPRVPLRVAALTPRVPLVAASVSLEKSAMRIANAVAVIGIVASRMTISEAATCECTGRKRGTAESKGNCKDNHGLTQIDPPFHRVVEHFMNVPLRNRLDDIAAVRACLRQNCAPAEVLASRADRGTGQPPRFRTLRAIPVESTV
jgi:hypothetical protein